MILKAITWLALAWVAVGSILAWVALKEFHAPEKQPAREAWRRQHMDRYHADTQGDFLRSEAGFLWVYFVVLILWPWLLLRSMGGKQV